MTILEFKNLLLLLVKRTKETIENNHYFVDRNILPFQDIYDNTLLFLDCTCGEIDKERCNQIKDIFCKMAKRMLEENIELRTCYSILEWIELVVQMQPSEDDIAILSTFRQNAEMINRISAFMTNMLGYEWWQKLLDNSEDEEIHELLEVIRQKGKIEMLNFHGHEKYKNMDINLIWDSNQDMYYYIYCDKKLYFPMQDTEMLKQYIRDIMSEQDKACAHSYKCDKCVVKEGDVILDIGAAEGNFSLEYIDVASHVYIVEPDEKWRKPLRATFAPYMDKVTFVEKYVGNETSDVSITIDDLICDNKVDFIKMDIEGAEYSAVQGAKKVLQQDNVKCAICTYHNKEDAERIGNYLKNMNYGISFSRGYIGPQWNLLFWNEQSFLEGDIRRGVLFAYKTVEKIC